LFWIVHNGKGIKQRETSGLEWKDNHILQLHWFLIHYYYYYYYICYIYVRYLQLYTWNKPCLYGTYCCSCSLFTVCTTCNVISPVKCFLYIYISTSRSLCAVHNMAFFSSLISCFPIMFLRYCLSDFEVVPFTPVTTGITFAFTFHMHWISIVRYSYIRIFLVSFLFTFLSALIATSIDMHVYCLLSWIVMSGLLLRYFCWFALLVP